MAKKQKTPLERWNSSAVNALKDYLRNLPPADKDAVWYFLDENPDAIYEMIECVGQKDGHPWVRDTQG